MRRTLILFAALFLALSACTSDQDSEPASTLPSIVTTTAGVAQPPTTNPPSPPTTVTPVTTTTTPPAPPPTTTTTLPPTATRQWTEVSLDFHTFQPEIAMLQPAFDVASVADIAFDPSGGTWIATPGSISHWSADGLLLREFTMMNGRAPVDVRSIEIAPNGDVWAATGAGLARLEGSSWLTISPMEPAPSSQLTFDSDGVAWFVTNQGLTSFDGETWMIYDSPAPVERELLLTAEVATSQSVVYLGSGVGIRALDTETMMDVPLPSRGGDQWILDMAAGPGGELWTLSEAEGRSGLYIERVTGDSREGLTVPASPRGQPSIEADSKGDLWYAAADASQNAHLYRLEDGSWAEVEALTDADWGWRAAPQVAFGPGGEPWLYGDAGAYRHTDDGWVSFGTTPVRALPGSPTSLAIAPDGRAAVAIGIKTGMIVDGEYTELTSASGHGGPNRLAFDTDGTLWRFDDRAIERLDEGVFAEAMRAPINIDLFGFTPDGLWVSDCFCGDSEVSHYDGSRWTTYGLEHGLSRGNLTTFATGSDGTVWTAGPEGLARHDGRRWETFDTPTVVSDAGISQRPMVDSPGLAVDSRGNAWLTASGGVMRFDGVEAEHFAAPDHVELDRTIAVGPGDSVWVVSKGFSGMDPKILRLADGAWSTFDTTDGIPQRWIHDFDFGPGGAMWLATDAGIAIVPGPSYVVRSGDTLRGIAREFMIPLDELLEANLNLGTSDRLFGDLIFPGDVIDF